MKKIFLILVITFGILLISGCSNESTLDKVLEDNNYIVVDVRTSSEYSESHVKGSINIPYDEIDESTDLDKGKTILVYCRSGARSGKAYNTLTSLGYDVIDLGAYDTVTLEKE